MLIQSLKKHRFFLLLALIFVILRLPSLFEPNWYGDEGVYLTLGQAIRKGLVLYNQIHDNKPPTLYYMAAVAQTVFGFRLLLAIWMVPTVYVFHQLSRKLLTSRLARWATLFFLIITSIPLFEGNIANSEIFMLLPTIIGVLLIFQSISFSSVIASGLLLGFAFTLKVPAALEFGFLFVWIFLISCHFNLRLIKWKPTIIKLLVFSFSFALPFLLYALYFYLLGAFNNFLFAAVLQNFGYLSSWATGSQSAPVTSGGLLGRGVILAVFWLFVYFCTVKKIISPAIAFVSFWFSATVFAALLSARPYPHYLIQVIPSLTLLIFLIFTGHVKNIIRGGLVVLALFLVFIFFHYQFYVYPVYSYYRNFYGHLTTLNSPDYRSFFGSEVNNTYAIASYIKTNTSPAEKIFVWGDNPFIYVLSDRLPVGRFTVAYHIADFNQYQVVADQLRIDFPEFIVYYPQPSRPYPQLDDFINRYYFASSTFGSTIIYRRIDHHYASL
jgi:hypothetical protein